MRNRANPLKHPRHISEVEKIMKFRRRWQKRALHFFPHRNCGVDQILKDFVDLLRETRLRKNGLNDRLKDKTYLGTQTHVDYKEVMLESVGYVVPSSSGMVHCAHKAEIFDELKISSFVFLQSVKSVVLNKLSDNLQRNLVSPFVFLRHGHIVYKENHFLSVLWPESFSYLCLAH